jgi:hypothetical protein
MHRDRGNYVSILLSTCHSLPVSINRTSEFLDIGSVIPFNMSLTILAQLLLLFISFVNGQNNNNMSIECPFHISCSHTYNQILKFPSLPVSEKLILNDIDCKFQVLDLSHPKKCFSSFFLTYNFSVFYPFRSNFPFRNITFFNCSSVTQHHLKSRDQTYTYAQDMLSCPIYVADSTESVVKLDLLRCTRMFDKVLPTKASYIRGNYLHMNWSETNFDSQCLEYELHNKSKKNHTSIILETIGELNRLYLYIPSVLFLFFIFQFF